MTPLPDASMDRILIVHALETDEYPHDLLEEVWRIPRRRRPGAEIVAPEPDRTLGARRPTPFDRATPIREASCGNCCRRRNSCRFIAGDEALYVPPFQRASLLRSAPAFERIAGRFSLPGGGVHIVEATKQLYRPVTRRAVRRLPVELEPAMAPPARKPGLRGYDARRVSVSADDIPPRRRTTAPGTARRGSGRFRRCHGRAAPKGATASVRRNPRAHWRT
ncbi:MAG: hypothetical protein U1E25_12310 [Methylocystis sp.]